MKKLLLLFGIILLSGYNLYAQEGRGNLWTLEECIDRALEKNLAVLRGELDVSDTEIQYGQAKADLFPSFNVGTGYSNRWGRSIDPTTNLFSTQRIQSLGIQASSGVTLYGGSRLRNTIKQNELNLDATSFDLESAKNDVMLNVTTAFLNVILNVELLENSRLQLETTQTQLETVRKQVQVGALAYSNELDLVAQVESNGVAVINAENDLRFAKLRLKQLLLIPAVEPFEIEIPDLAVEIIEPINETSEDIYNVAENILPEVKSADLLVQSSDIGVKIARGGLDPRLSANADLFTNYSSAADRERFLADPSGGSTTIPTQIGYVINPLDGTTRIPVFSDIEIPNGESVDSYPISDQIQDNWSYSLGLSLQIPIFNGLISRANYQRAKIQAQRAETFAQETRQNLRQTIELAYNDAVAASKTYNASTKQVASLEEAFRAAQRSFDLGAINNYDYQVASNNLFRARSDLLRAKYNYIFTLKVLDFYLGKPLSLDN
jgi:outer membrane protein